MPVVARRLPAVQRVSRLAAQLATRTVVHDQTARTVGTTHRQDNACAPTRALTLASLAVADLIVICFAL